MRGEGKEGEGGMGGEKGDRRSMQGNPYPSGPPWAGTPHEGRERTRYALVREGKEGEGEWEGGIRGTVRGDMEEGMGAG